uniref:Uncharacterized protein n=1 Tax=Nelumbo nucifera TaxID=4432 RepID=A0A822Y6F7_NELNU|nr:TPA_asm: hypothetical protein HUJ06_026642 [Nelumbo nucifera]
MVSEPVLLFAAQPTVIAADLDPTTTYYLHPSGLSLFMYLSSFTFEGGSEQCVSHYIQQQQQPKLIDCDKLSSFLPIDDSGIPPYYGSSEWTLQKFDAANGRVWMSLACSAEDNQRL